MWEGMCIKEGDACQCVIWVPKGTEESKEIPRLNILFSLRGRCLWLMGCYGKDKFITSSLSISTISVYLGLNFHQLLTMLGLISQKHWDSWDVLAVFDIRKLTRFSDGQQAVLVSSWVYSQNTLFLWCSQSLRSIFLFIRPQNKTPLNYVSPSIPFQTQTEIRCQVRA